MNFIYQLFVDNRIIKPWKDIKVIIKIYWLQIIDTLPKMWNDIILKDKGNANNLVIFDYHVIRKSQICSVSKLTTK